MWFDNYLESVVPDVTLSETVLTPMFSACSK